jgi:5-methylcytosine-specific restriction endonuclease McrA
MTKKEWHKLDKKTEIACKTDKGWKCEICGRSKEQGYQIHFHHWVARTYTSLRWVMENIFVVCYVCHKKFEEDPYWSVKTAEQMRGTKWIKLINKIKVKINKKSYDENIYLMDKSLEEVLKSYK